MADINNSDITEAKRRVLEMQNRASRFVDGKNQAEQGSDFAQGRSKNTDSNNIPNPQNKQNTKADTYDKNDKGSTDSEQKDEQKSFFMILALIMLLSKEDADNTLILALLYLLL